MTALAPLPEVQPPPVPDSLEEDSPVDPEVQAYRTRLRRRMLLWSLPGVLLVVLVALKLLSMPALALVTQATYDAKSYNRSVAAADTLGVANVFEPWVHYFDRGTALARIGVLVDSRKDLEAAMARVPSSDTSASCRVRTDLLLVVEQQGDSAVLDQAYAKANSFYKHALTLYDDAPTGCLTKQGSPQKPDSAQPLQDAKGRLDQKQAQAQQDAGGGKPKGGSGSGGQSPGGQGQNGQGQGGQGQDGQQNGQGDGGSGGSSSSQDPLDKLKQQNGQAQQEQQQNDDRNRDFNQNPEDYGGKPW